MRRFRILYFLSFFILMLPCFGNIKWGAGTEEALKYFGAGYEISDCGGGTVCYTYKNVEKTDIVFTETGLRFLDNKLISWYGASDINSETALDIMKEFEQKYGMKFEHIEEGGISRLFYKNNDGEVYVFLMKEDSLYYFTVYYKGAEEIRLEAVKEQEINRIHPAEKEKIRKDI
ncbi:Uncharacterised protein [Sebaldella termitidis]|uniref:Uncharacterized protein n=1 Tax=Sebaldella termitidis (strain ATCC 33386 / NCTC 11300) TaxID=526218 RepID=D1AIR9_SEBTE|nr:hypothetical protein [Sebaldella termitidis]ACZ08653.1 hypothetical protein Sterm_1795 [Sebaldella termitidis ATCC 33386]SUI23969.1 Uncharacterised protein [Sebaldella termitidis]